MVPARGVRYRFVQLDVFTDHVFGGNQLAVFPRADGLGDAEMQAIAREMNYAETTFVLPATDPGALCRVRIFTPAAELPIAGHPVVGTAIALAHEGRIVPGTDARAHVSFQLGVGTLPIDVTFAERLPRFARMSQPVPSFEPWRGDSDALAAALGLARDDLDEQTFPLERGSAGVPFAYVPLRSLEVIGRASPDPGLAPVLTAADCHGVYLFTILATGDTTAHIRMFAPTLGIIEDAATGGAAGPFGAYLLRHGHIAPGADGVAHAQLEQGIEMGRPSRLEVEVIGTPDAIQAVHVGGQAVLVAEGELLLR
jgi:trans-2,3-dihydro-3-hydroxyanthranilate isomerase